MYICTRVPHYVFILNFGISLISAVTKEVKQQLTQHRILPDVIEVFPTSVIHVEYEQQALKIAELLKLDQVKTKPSVSWPAAPDALYTLIMTDADYPAPSAPNRTEFLHWMIINMEGSTLDVSNAETTAEYLAPLANSTPGCHRYVFTAYRQESKEKLDDFPLLDTRAVAERANFSTIAFVEKHQLGYPVAVNFYKVDFNK